MKSTQKLITWWPVLKKKMVACDGIWWSHKINEILCFAMEWIHLEAIKLSEISQPVPKRQITYFPQFMLIEKCNNASFMSEIDVLVLVCCLQALSMPLMNRSLLVSAFYVLFIQLLNGVLRFWNLKWYSEIWNCSSMWFRNPILYIYQLPSSKEKISMWKIICNLLFVGAQFSIADKCNLRKCLPMGDWVKTE